MLDNEKNSGIHTPDQEQKSQILISPQTEKDTNLETSAKLDISPEFHKSAELEDSQDVLIIENDTNGIYNILL